MGPKPKAVVLLSGGLDSATTLAVARSRGFETYALTFRYGQRHEVEIEAARRIAARMGAADHAVVEFDLRRFGGSALTADIDVPKDRSAEEIGQGIPVTYVPARNTIFLSFALAWAEVLGAQDIFIGINALDYSVSGDARVWVRTKDWARLMPIRDFCMLPDGDYETVAVDPQTLELIWRRVTGRYRHRVGDKKCFRILLERGREITVTEDHSLFTIDPATSTIRTIRGSEVRPGLPLVVPFDLSGVAHAWAEDLSNLDLNAVLTPLPATRHRHSIKIQDGCITNRLGSARVPVSFPVTDDFLYAVGLWLAEGGKSLDSRSSTLAFSVGSLAGAVEALARFFGTFGVRLHPSPANRFDYHVHSSVMVAVFRHLGLLGTSRSGGKRFPDFFWRLSQRQRRIVVAGLWDGDGSHVFNGELSIAQKSHALVEELYHCLILDGIFAVVKPGQHGQKVLSMARARDISRFASLYPLRHPSKLKSCQTAGQITGRDKVTGLWKCEGLWRQVAEATLPVGAKTRIYNYGGKYEPSVRGQRSAFAAVPGLQKLVASRLAFLRVVQVTESPHEEMFDLSVEGAENFVANGVLAHNSGYPDCRPEYIAAFQRMADLATKAGVEGRQRLTIHAPLIHMTKAEIIRTGLALGVDYALTVSCYDPAPDGAACGRCDACLLRLKGFAEAGVPDPARYRAPDPAAT